LEAVSSFRNGLEKRRLSDAGVAAQDQRASVSRPRLVEQARDLLALVLPADDHELTLGL